MILFCSVLNGPRQHNKRRPDLAKTGYLQLSATCVRWAASSLLFFFFSNLSLLLFSYYSSSPKSLYSLWSQDSPQKNDWSIIVDEHLGKKKITQNATYNAVRHISSVVDGVFFSPSICLSRSNGRVLPINIERFRKGPPCLFWRGRVWKPHSLVFRGRHRSRDEFGTIHKRNEPIRFRYLITSQQAFDQCQREKHGDGRGWEGGVKTHSKPTKPGIEKFDICDIFIETLTFDTNRKE